jgi:hypothetical protein
MGQLPITWKKTHKLNNLDKESEKQMAYLINNRKLGKG